VDDHGAVDQADRAFALGRLEVLECRRRSPSVS
jgi:hypothetical protein